MGFRALFTEVRDGLWEAVIAGGPSGSWVQPQPLLSLQAHHLAQSKAGAPGKWGKNSMDTWMREAGVSSHLALASDVGGWMGECAQAVRTHSVIQRGWNTQHS